jgi:phytoene dehydrogenase-like protein
VLDDDRPLTRAAYDVLIVGAGAAGLAAGRLLAEAGKRVAIIEARTRVGGRIWTRHLASTNAAPPVPVELGAEFVHGLPRATWALIEEAKLKTVPLEGAQLWYAGGRLTAHAPQEHAGFDELERMTQQWMAGRWQGRDFTFA